MQGKSGISHRSFSIKLSYHDKRIAHQLRKTGKYEMEYVADNDVNDIEVYSKIKSSIEKWTIVAAWIGAIGTMIAGIVALLQWLK